MLERGSIDKLLIVDVGLIQLSFIPVGSPNICKHFSQIAPRVCTLVLFFIYSNSKEREGGREGKEGNRPRREKEEGVVQRTTIKQ